MLDINAAFEELLYPVELELFFEEVYEKNPILVRREDPSYYSGILDTDDIDLLLRSPATASKFLRVHKEGHEVPPYKWSRGSEIDVDAVSALFANGATIILNGANRFFWRLAEFCNNVERRMRFAVQPNIYITPASSRGFDQHYDDHDVFIMQVHGKKAWRLYGSPIELPSPRQKHHWCKDPNRSPEESFQLAEGDLLYIPRGYVHEAETSAEASIHVTFGLHPPYLYELVDELARRSRDVPGFRRAVPMLLARTGTEDFGARIKQLLHVLVDDADIGEFLDTIERRYISHRNPGRRVPFLDLLSLPSVDEAVCVAPVDSLVYRLERENDQIYLRLPGTNLTFPSFLEETLRDLLECETRRVGEIRGLLDGEGRIGIAKQLIAAGVLRIAQGTEP